MTLSLMRTTRLAALLVLGFILGVVALTVASATGAKTFVLHSLGMNASPKALAIVSCDVPKNAGDDVYFVSCGGFF